MPRAKQKAAFICQSCGHEEPKWFGCCAGCGAWNTAGEAPAVTGERRHWTGARAQALARPLSEAIPRGTEPRIGTGFDEFDRVLGGGVVRGSVVLVGGDPGIGKSTLLLQSALRLANDRTPVLYVAGEESERQVAERAERLGGRSAHVSVFTESDLGRILEQVGQQPPALVVIDSIQSILDSSLPAAPGSVTQVRDCAFELVACAKSQELPIFLVGHVTKDGDVAGPRILEHMVDAVLYLEGERYQELRVLRSRKNRFGSTTEIGLFEMGTGGFVEVEDASAVLLADRQAGSPGSVVSATLDGNRALLVEVQALAAPSVFSNPQQRAAGFPALRLAVLLGVLRVRGGVDVSRHDVFISIPGGFRVEEPGIDLAACLAVASSLRGAPVPADMVVVGEVGLGGEVRRATGAERRLHEAARLGFKRALVPRSDERSGSPPAIAVKEVATLTQAIDVALGGVSSQPGAPPGESGGAHALPRL